MHRWFFGRRSSTRTAAAAVTALFLVSTIGVLSSDSAGAQIEEVGGGAFGLQSSGQVVVEASPRVSLPTTGGGPYVASLAAGSVPGVLTTGTLDVSTEGSGVGSASVLVRSSARTAGLNLLAGALRADSVESSCSSLATGSSANVHITSLSIAGVAVALPSVIPPNDFLNLAVPGVTSVELNRQVLTDSTSSTTILVEALRVGLLVLGVPTTVVVSESECSATGSHVHAAPQVTTVSPDVGPDAGGTTVRITGMDLSAATSVKFGSKEATFTVVSDTKITAIAPSGSGTVDVTVTSSDGTSPALSTTRYSYVARPTVTLITPAFGTDAGGTPVVVTGTDLCNASRIDFGSSATRNFSVDLACTTVTVLSPPGSGAVHVTVTTPGGTSSTGTADLFTFVSTPAVTTILPNSGPSAGGTSVTITGIGFSDTSRVDFGSNTATGVVVISSTQITAIAPSGSGTVDVTVTTPGGTSPTAATDLFTYTSAPVVSLIVPAGGTPAGGTIVTITGIGFTNATSVNFGLTGATFTVISSTQINAIAPPGSGTVDVTLTTPGGTSPTSPVPRYSYVAQPVVTSIAPITGLEGGGTTVVVTGGGLCDVARVNFGSSIAPSFSVDAACTEIAAIAPPGTGTIDVTVTTLGGTSATSAEDRFTYVAVPVIDVVSSDLGSTSAGTAVIIEGSGFLDVTTVTFGVHEATDVVVHSSGEITAVVPAGSGTEVVKVTTPGGTSLASHVDQFTYDRIPAVDSLTSRTGPASGLTRVTLKGKNLCGATRIDFGTLSSLVFSVSPECTRITAFSPPGAGTVDVTVTTPGGVSQSSPVTQFFYRASRVVSLRETRGYWLVAADGGVFSYGDAHFYGSASPLNLHSPIVGMASTADGLGYWLVAADGGVFSYGDAHLYGSASPLHLHSPIVGMASTADGLGYWLVAADGQVFSYGNALHYGSAAHLALRGPAVGVVPGKGGLGYWIDAADGGVFSYGNAQFYGSASPLNLQSPIVGMASTEDGLGYWLVTADGQVFSYGDAHFYGSAAHLALSGPVVGIVRPD